ncbi:hypothetical protein T484DRAFT_1814225, partial [Baffinella frigidus]
TEWVSDEEVTCISAAGVHGTKRVVVTAGIGAGTITETRVVVTAGTGAGTITETVSYDATAPATVSNRAITNIITILQLGGLGEADYTGAARVGGSGCERTEWVSDEEVLCGAAAGVGATLRVAVTVGEKVGSVTEAVSYQSGVLTYNPRGKQPASGFKGTLVGRDFGTFDTSVLARVGGTAQEATAWGGDTSVECRVAQGVGGTMRVAVTVGGGVSSGTEAVSYDVTTAVEGYRGNAAPAGNESKFVSVTSIGYSDYTSSARLGASACEASEWLSDSAIQLRTPAGIGASQSVMLTAGVRVGTLTEAVSYDIPRLLEFDASNGPNYESTNFTLSALHLGTSDYTARGAVGFTACEVTEWTSDEEVVCTWGIGVGGTLRVVVTAGTRVGSTTEALSYDASSLLGFSGPATSPTAGGVDWTINSGGDLGSADYTSTARVGGTQCEASSWLSDAELHCLTPSGLGGTRTVAVTVGVQAASLSEAASYDAPSIMAAMDDAGHRNPAGFDATVAGRDFGQSDTSVRLRVGSTATEATAWTDDTRILCSVARGVGGSLTIAVTAGSVAGTATEGVSYDAVTPLTLSLPSGDFPLDWTGAQRLGVFAASVGGGDYTGGGRVGATASEGSEWVSDSAVVCLTAAGNGGTLSVVVTAGTLTEAASYAAPHIHNLAMANRAPATPGAMSTLGFNEAFQADYSARVRVGHTACEATEWTSADSLTCLLPAGITGSLPIAVTLGAIPATLTHAISYDAPSPSHAAPAHAAPAATLNIAGSGFGGWAYTAAVRVGVTSCEATLWASDVHLECLLSTGVGRTSGIAVTAGVLVGSVTAAVSYDLSVSAITLPGDASRPTLGGFSAAIAGGGLGGFDYTAGARVGGTACEAT